MQLEVEGIGAGGWCWHGRGAERLGLKGKSPPGASVFVVGLLICSLSGHRNLLQPNLHFLFYVLITKQD